MIEAWVISVVIDLYQNYELSGVLQTAYEEGAFIIYPTYIKLLKSNGCVIGKSTDILIRDATGVFSICEREFFNQTYERVDAW